MTAAKQTVRPRSTAGTRSRAAAGGQAGRVDAVRRRTAAADGKRQDMTLATYDPLDSAGAFRARLTVRERGALDRALNIVGRALVERPALDNATAVKNYMLLQIGAEPVEHFCVLFLDSQHRAISFERMFRGTIAQTSVYPAEVARLALLYGASAVVLAHNHPSGSVQPSRVDEALTQTLKAALALLSVRVLDHVIVGGGKALSMAEREWM